MKNAAAFLAVVLIYGLASAGEIGFTIRPTASRAGDDVKISFAVSAQTDVAVFIEDANGKIVRHLVAGVLGKSPPPPLQPNSLSQVLAWDGKTDYGKPAGRGPFRARVALGLGARYDKVVSSDPGSLERVTGLGTGPDGTLYVVTQAGGAVWRGPQVLAFNRDGSYKRMITPFHSGLSQDRARGFAAMELAGRPAPLLHGERMGLYPGFTPPWPTNLAVSGDGERLYLLCCGYRDPPPPSIGVLDSEGGCPAEEFVVQIGAPGKRPVFDGFSCIAISSDGKHAYVGGLRPHVYEKDEHCAVFRLALPDRSGCTPFFGDPAKPGKDERHLGGAPHGLAVDGKGRLFVADHANDRVVILRESDGGYAGEFPVGKPDYLGVDPRTGAVYVACHPGGRGTTVELIKFTPTGTGRAYRQLYKTTYRFSRFQYAMTVDASAEPAVVWMGAKFGRLVRIEDNGTGFGPPRIVSPGVEGLKGTPECYLSVVVDRRRKEVYTRNSPGGGLWYRYSERTDRIEKVYIPGSAGGGGKGFQVVPHPDGNLYGLRWPYEFLRWTRDGKPLAWEVPLEPTEEQARTHGVGRKPIPPGRLEAFTARRHISFVPVSMVELPHTLGVRPSDGHLFVFSPMHRGRLPKVLHEYLPTGRRVTKDPIIWKTSDAIIGPKFDAAGNIYVAEVVTPKGWLYPPELVAHFQKTGVKGLAGPAAAAARMYGSIVKFSPKGGLFDFGGTGSAQQPNPFQGQPKLATDLDSLELEYYDAGRNAPAKVIGAEWVHPGIGHVGLFPCNCENVTFDVDEFGRVFFPDLHLFRVRVIDTNGNPMTQFGGYGNAESTGPDSPVVDSRTGRLRPKRPGEELKSPFAEPDIALAWPVGVGVTDRYAYVGDGLNRRLMRLRLTYAVEATCEVR